MQGIGWIGKYRGNPRGIPGGNPRGKSQGGIPYGGIPWEKSYGYPKGIPTGIPQWVTHEKTLHSGYSNSTLTH